MSVPRFISGTVVMRYLECYIADGNIVRTVCDRTRGRQGLSKRDLFIRQRSPKLFARALNFVRGDREGRSTELWARGRKRKKERRSHRESDYCQQSRTWRPFRPLVLRPIPPSVSCVPSRLTRPLFILVILSHARETGTPRKLPFV